jgi:hypothetical protein
LDFIHHELTCSRPDQAKVVFWQMQKMKISISRIKSQKLKFSTFCLFLTDSESPETNFFKSVFKYLNMITV